MIDSCKAVAAPLLSSFLSGGFRNREWIKLELEFCDRQQHFCFHMMKEIGFRLQLVESAQVISEISAVAVILKPLKNKAFLTWLAVLKVSVACVAASKTRTRMAGLPGV